MRFLRTLFREETALLSVRFFPFRERTPSWIFGSWPKPPTLRLSSLSDTIPSNLPFRSVTGDEAIFSDRSCSQASWTEVSGLKVLASRCTRSLSVLCADFSAWLMGNLVSIMLRLLVRSDPKVVSTHEFDPKKPAKLDLVWALQFHKAGIGPATLRVIDSPVFPASATFLRKARYKDKSDDRMVAFLWIRIVNIGLFFSLSRLGLTQSDDPRTQFAFSFEHLEGGITAFPEPNGGSSIGSMDCSCSEPAVDR